MGGLGGILGSLGSMGGGGGGGGGGGLGSILQLIMGMMGNKGGGGGGGGAAGASSPWTVTQPYMGTSGPAMTPAVSRGAVMSTGSPTGQGAFGRAMTGFGNVMSDYAKLQTGGGGGTAGSGAPAGGQPQAGQDAGLASVLMLLRLLQSGQGPGGARGSGQITPVYTPSSRYTTGYSPGYGAMR